MAFKSRHASLKRFSTPEVRPERPRTPSFEVGCGFYPLRDASSGGQTRQLQSRGGTTCRSPSPAIGSRNAGAFTIRGLIDLHGPASENPVDHDTAPQFARAGWNIGGVQAVGDTIESQTCCPQRFHLGYYLSLPAIVAKWFSTRHVQNLLQFINSIWAANEARTVTSVVSVDCGSVWWKSPTKRSHR